MLCVVNLTRPLGKNARTWNGPIGKDDISNSISIIYESFHLAWKKKVYKKIAHLLSSPDNILATLHFWIDLEHVEALGRSFSFSRFSSLCWTDCYVLSSASVTPESVRMLDQGSGDREVYQRWEVDMGESLCHCSRVCVRVGVGGIKIP